MKPEKILGKKFVRGKPYYKIKWEDCSKDQATWETPPALIRHKAMIDNYQIKNWGMPLDQKFLDPTIYVNKGFANRSKALSDKKQIKETKRKEKKKIEQSSEDSCSEKESQSEESPQKKSAMKKQRKNLIKKESNDLRKKKKSQGKQKSRDEKSIMKFQAESIMIVDSVSFQENKQQKKQPLQINKENPQNQDCGLEPRNQIYTEQNKNDCPQKKIADTNKATDRQDKSICDKDDKACEIVVNQKVQANEVNIPSQCNVVNHQEDKKGQNNKGIEEKHKVNDIEINIEGQNNNDVVLIPNQNMELVNQKLTVQQPQIDENVAKKGQKVQKKSFKLANPIMMHVESQEQERKKVLNIYHLQKLSSRVHLYLVEMEDGKMVKLTSSQLVEWHPDDFVSFLERTLRVKKTEL